MTGVSSRLNSATGTPLEASMGAKPAAGYTTEDVPTCPEHMSEVGESIIIIHHILLPILCSALPYYSQSISYC